ncbi:alpha/beta-hydrolase [Polyplosphaeria fusca]|uniref:Alpha/beta-hydrolase n=1 Tax=Polyplosphaeria fusca TaxID=682080 RepID=A0A9P4UV94_9PLEO|nr:alpha/beta-hydrolase [Polyplosphaeria fusca]
MRSTIKFGLAGLVFSVHGFAVPTEHNTTDMVTDWSQITPSTDLQWKPCFENFTCTRLEVPLDYEDSSVGTAAIAFIKYTPDNATKAAKDVLFNPGGPGNSGVSLITDSYEKFTKILGPSYNLVGFDPRGVQYSEPNVDCFHGDAKRSKNFVIELLERTTLNTEEKINAQFDLSSAYGDFCAGQLNDSARYVSTPAVARDMLTYVEKEATRRGEALDDAKLYYMGFSYGTVLGSTFATLFPERVGRVALDGVVDATQYYDGSWATYLQDSDVAIKSFFQFCYNAGPKRCAYYADSTREIETRYQQLLYTMKDHPIPVFDTNSVEVPRLATYDMLRFYFFTSSYRTEANFPVLAQVLLDLENHNGSSLITLTGSAPCYDCDKSKLPILNEDLSPIPILCADADRRFNLTTVMDLKENLAERMGMSTLAGEFGTNLVLYCRKWAFHPPESQKFDGKLGAKTAAPLLFTSNRIDPSTPLKHAQTMHSFFPGSALLVNNGISHCTINTPSDCMHGHIRRYFDEGILPPANTTCEPNSQPFFAEAE